MTPTYGHFTPSQEANIGKMKQKMAAKMGGMLDRFNKRNKGAGKQTRYLN